MDIYILRDGQEIGPFSEEMTQSLLKQGSVLINDLAWQPGMPQWIPLHSVLYPAPTPAMPPRPPPPSPSAVTGDDAFAASVADPEPATAKQKAFLSYMGMPVPPGLTKDQAALLINDTLENPGDPGRLGRWNEERLRLHPELFQAEIQAKKDNRANYFYEITQAEGGHVFDRVTKAHCQVLVAFLDVHHPSWDANEHHATWDHFFPAIAEKFPQLVKKEWKGKLKYRGPKVAPELTRRTAGANSPQTSRAGFPMGAVVRGVAVGVGILLVLYAGYVASRNKPWLGKSAVSANAKVGEKNVASGAEPGNASKATSLDLEKLFAQTSPVSNNQASSVAGPSSAGSTPTVPMTNGTGTPPSTGEPTFPPSATAVPLFDPNAPSVPTTAPAVSLDPGAVQPRTSLVITKATEVQLRFGRAKLPPGTVVKFVSQDGGMLRVRYGNDVVAVPVASTDFLGDLPAVTTPATPPATPGTSPASIAPATTPPSPTSPTSLF